jgi:hypothetical protein
MKTIKKTLVFDDGEVVTVSTAFPQSIGRARLAYTGPARRILDLTGATALPEHGYAEDFHSWWDQFDGQGVRITTEETGDWDVVDI